MDRTPRRTAALLLLTILAIAAITLAGCGSSGDDGKGGDSSTKKVTSTIFTEGQQWTVTVKQDASVASPSTDAQPYLQKYQFTVAEAPTEKRGEWKVVASLVGAQGPFAEGFRLYYVERDGVMVLERAGIGKQDPVEPAAAKVLFGTAFPLDEEITAPPVDRTEDATGTGGGEPGEEDLPPPLPTG